ncbi:MAG: hypothetical protein A2749_02700 [Parcubacteria group bacterium RIFCSPHIGHO2_01_FULL_45_26]|nr:MAG: hypothetical protein A2749_02700 [Parcubacteria group bacterium RIFCSPHIGHO2_01_FULL_45_26]
MLLTVCGTFAATAAGQAPSLSLVIASQYVSPHGILLHDGPVLQTDLRATFPGGFTAGVWWSTGLNGEGLSSDKADELDPYVDWSRKWTRWQLQSRLAYFNFIELDRMRGDLLVASVEIGRELKLGKHTLVPFTRLEHRSRLPSFDFGRWMPVLGLSHQWALSSDIRFSQRAGLVYDSGVPVSDSGYLLQYKATLAIKLSAKVSLEPFIRLSLPLEALDSRERQVIGAIGLNLR